MDLNLTACKNEAFADALDFLDHQIRSGVKLGLESTRQLLARLDNPERRCRFIHVAGTNGKGSVCCLLASALAASGYKVGMYTSPHLVNVRERYRINQRAISEWEFARLMEEIRRRGATLFGKEGAPSFFEVCTVLAFLYFAREQCDVAIMEVGMGGRLDATNVLTPELAVITRIDLDHTRALGETRYEIAGEKAGIIKEGRPVVVGYQEDDAMQRLREEVSSRSAPAYWMCEHTKLIETQLDADRWLQANRFLIDDREMVYESGLLGPHQLENMGLAWSALHSLQRQGWFLDKTNIAEAWRRTVWPGRFQRLRPDFIVDGAHNLSGLEVFYRTIRQLYPPEKKWRVFFGVLEAKQWQQMLDLLATITEEFIFTGIDHPRAATPQMLEEYCRTYHPRIKVRTVPRISTVANALIKDSIPTLGVGSLYMLGEFFATINGGEPVELWTSDGGSGQ
ncbi:MAG: bifunctional folylpolyglutamate synthase/dihydrofolate synthase [Lentisphaerae bacterium]|nr:MAG: bifunctional folylpolyglutamate synthase/dihydrofolate synthase [Lentisphaerota bacterium]